jgi:hypothetical protein
MFTPPVQPRSSQPNSGSIDNEDRTDSSSPANVRLGFSRCLRDAKLCFSLTSTVRSGEGHLQTITSYPWRKTCDVCSRSAKSAKGMRHFYLKPLRLQSQRI